MIEKILGVPPHHFGSRTSVTVLAIVSAPSKTNGPAEVAVPVTHPLLKADGSPFREAGKRGLNKLRQSAKGCLKVTTASFGPLPCATLWMPAYPAGAAARKAGFDPLRACHWAAKSASVIGAPSFQAALGLIS